jgi:arylsulfatase A-like enzyme
VLGNRTAFRDLHPEWITLPQLFKKNGYHTVRIGKIFHGGIDDPDAWSEGGGAREGDGGAGGHTLVIRGDAVPPPPGETLPALPPEGSQGARSDRIVVLDGNGEGHPDYRTADAAIQVLRKYKGQPLFLGCGFVKPHSPPCAPQRFLDWYDPRRIELTPDFAPWPAVPPGFPSAAIRKRNADLFIGRGATVAEAREVIRAYIASISWVDWNLGRVLAEVDRLGMRHNTIIVFTADHGYQLGEKGSGLKPARCLRWPRAFRSSLLRLVQRATDRHASGLSNQWTSIQRLQNSAACRCRQAVRATALHHCSMTPTRAGTGLHTACGARTEGPCTA